MHWLKIVGVLALLFLVMPIVCINLTSAGVSEDYAEFVHGGFSALGSLWLIGAVRWPRWLGG